MINFKKISLGLLLAGLSTVSLTPKAQAFQFSYLNQAANPGGGIDFNFEFQVDPGDTISSGQILSVRGFQQIRSAAMTDPQANQAGVVFADSIFDADQTLWNSSRVQFTSNSGLSSPNRAFRLQSFTVTATGVDNDEVNANFGGQPLSPTPVPEPLTILGSLAALGFGSRCQKEFAKKQSANSEEA